VKSKRASLPADVPDIKVELDLFELDFGREGASGEFNDELPARERAAGKPISRVNQMGILVAGLEGIRAAPPL